MRAADAMRVTLATDPGTPGRPNEDFAAVGPGVAVLLDGCTTSPAVTDIGCAHGVAWFARTLGTTFLAGLTADPRVAVRDALAGAIRNVRERHAGTCDLTNPYTPAATVVAVRDGMAPGSAASGKSVEFLVLSDSALVLDYEDGGTGVVTLGTRPAAGSDPGIVGSARAGSVDTDGLFGIGLLSDGATRIVDQYGLLTWTQAITIIRNEGPDELIRQVRAAEAGDPDRTRWPRSKDSDDATAVYWRFAD